GSVSLGRHGQGPRREAPSASHIPSLADGRQLRHARNAAAMTRRRIVLRPGLLLRPRSVFFAALWVCALAALPAAHASGARSFNSGPIQITADGSMVWVVNPDHDSVSRIATSNETVTEFPLPQPAGGPHESHKPRGLSVKEDGSEVWVACHDSDRVYVLRGTDGAVLARIDLPWGSGPYSVALSRSQSLALVTCLRSSKIAVIDV